LGFANASCQDTYELLSSYEDAPEPKIILPTDAIIKLRAAALNRVDLSIRARLGGAVTLPHFMEVSRTRPIIDRVFPLREAYAQQHLEEGKQFDNVILRIDG
jgi:NADPH:quinone reductase-like Zn-dependent oxidoreductase